MSKGLIIGMLVALLALGLAGIALAGNYAEVYQDSDSGFNGLFVGQYSSCDFNYLYAIQQASGIANVAMIVQAGPDNFVHLDQLDACCLNFALIEQTSPEDYPYETIEQKIEWALWNLDWAF